MSIIGVGACTLSFIGVVDRMPVPETSQEFGALSIQGNGLCANAVVAMSRWGCETSFVGKVGNDSRGVQIISTLAGEGVSTTHMVQQTNAVTQLEWDLVESGSIEFRRFYTHGSVDSLRIDEISAADLLEDAELVILDGRFLSVTREIAHLAREKEVPIVLCLDEYREELRPLLSLATHLVLSERVASKFFNRGSLEELCGAFLELGPSVCVITTGSEGAVGKSKVDPYTEARGYEVEVVDVLGADGVFLGAFAYSVLSQFSLEYTLRFANAAAGFSCQGLGPRSCLPTLDQVRAVLESHLV